MRRPFSHNKRPKEMLLLTHFQPCTHVIVGNGQQDHVVSRVASTSNSEPIIAQPQTPMLQPPTSPIQHISRLCSTLCSTFFPPLSHPPLSSPPSRPPSLVVQTISHPAFPAYPFNRQQHGLEPERPSGFDITGTPCGNMRRPKTRLGSL